jgi:hypothetical protein
LRTSKKNRQVFEVAKSEIVEKERLEKERKSLPY